MLMMNKQRRGVTLLELLVVVMLMGIFAVLVTMRFGRAMLSEFGSQSESRKVSLALLQAQRSSITAGDNHYLSFDGTTATSYQLMRRTGSGDVLVDGPHVFSTDVTVTVSHTVMEFNFEGQALAAYTVTILGVNRTWQASVVPITGAVSVVETTP